MSIASEEEEEPYIRKTKTVKLNIKNTFERSQPWDT